MNEQAHRSSPPNRVRPPTDQQFASGCSPPRLTATQLPSATELWLPPTRNFTVLMWRPHGRTHARESGHPGGGGGTDAQTLDSRFHGNDGKADSLISILFLFNCAPNIGRRQRQRLNSPPDRSRHGISHSRRHRKQPAFPEPFRAERTWPVAIFDQYSVQVLR